VTWVTAFWAPSPYIPERMSGPRDLTPTELERNGLGLIERRAVAGEAVTRVYCLRCGSQVAPERREEDPDWWACARGCNTLYVRAASDAAARPTT